MEYRKPWYIKLLIFPFQYILCVISSVDVTFYEGTQNLNWTQIMKTINQDPADFYAQGGWSFLKLHSEVI